MKTLWKKKKLLVMSNFFFSHSVFLPFRELSTIFIKPNIVVCKLFQFGMEESKICCMGKGKVNPFPNKPWFLHVYTRSHLKNTGGKEKLLITSDSPFSHSVFYLLGELSAIFIRFEIVVNKLFEFGRV